LVDETVSVREPLTVKVISSDGHIWNQREVISDICYAMSQNLDITICLNSEGPDLRALGLDILIESEGERYNYDLNKIFLRTDNVAETYDKVTVEKTFPWHLMVKCLDYDQPVSKAGHLHHFGIFIGRNNAPRLFIGSHLFHAHRDKTIHINHFDRRSDLSSANLGLEQLFVRYGVDNIENIVDYLKQCPINVQAGPPTTQSSELTYHRFQQLLDADKESFLKNYNDLFVEITCETYFTGDTFFPTEKTWRPMILKTPFIVQGPKGYLKKLQDMGFKTFHGWWSESYDHDESGTSWHEIVKVIDDLSTKSQQEIQQMLEDMQPVLEHNRARLLELCAGQLQS